VRFWRRWRSSLCRQRRRGRDAPRMTSSRARKLAEGNRTSSRSAMPVRSPRLPSKRRSSGLPLARVPSVPVTLRRLYRRYLPSHRAVSDTGRFWLCTSANLDLVHSRICTLTPISDRLTGRALSFTRPDFQPSSSHAHKLTDSFDSEPACSRYRAGFAPQEQDSRIENRRSPAGHLLRLVVGWFL
jgi:hypothetical protein